jgi:hypothetical protein
MHSSRIDTLNLGILETVSVWQWQYEAIDFAESS